MGCNQMRVIELPRKDFLKAATKEIEIIPDYRIAALVEVALSRRKNGKLRYSFGPAVVFLLYTGLGLGELLELEWLDIDFDGGSVNISKI